MKTMSVVGLVSLAFLAGCAAGPASPELREARSAYSEAQAGPAATMAPARLEEARQALEAAEKAHKDDPDSDEAKARAYIATRRAQSATVRGKEKQAEDELKANKKEYDELERRHLKATKEELAEARAGLRRSKEELSQSQFELSKKENELSKSQQKLDASQQELSKSKEDLNKSQQELDKSKADLSKSQEELAKERAAREKAEASLQSAMASLDELGKVQAEKRGVVITLSGSVLFAVGQHSLLPVAKNKLSEVAKVLKEQGYGSIVVEGHTDSQGTESNNQALSKRRAEAVRAHLVSEGLDGTKVRSLGIGESRPIAPNNTPEGRANNRRVEIIVNPES